MLARRLNNDFRFAIGIGYGMQLQQRMLADVANFFKPLLKSNNHLIAFFTVNASPRE